MLRQALAFADGRARVQILNTIGDRRDAGSLDLLTSSASDKDHAVAEAAIAALGKIGGDRAAKALAAVGSSSQPALQEALAEASLCLAEQFIAAGKPEVATPILTNLLAPSQPLQVQRSALAALFPLDKDAGELRMMNVLRGTNAALKPIAIAGVVSLPDHSASSVFSTEIYHLQPVEQAWLIESLAVRADVDARLTITTCLSSPYDVVRCASATAIGHIGDSWYVPMLAHALSVAKSREEIHVIENAVVLLSGGGATDKAISEAISRSSGPAGAALMSAVIRRIGLAANPLLLTQLSQIDPTMAKFAFRALGRTAGPEDIGPILQALILLHDPDVRPDAQSAVEKVLSRLPDISRRSEILREALGRTDYLDSRCSLICLLPIAADAPALAAVKAAAADPEAKVREAALRALADWPNLSAWDMLAASYRQPERASLRWIAMRGMVRLVEEENAQPSPHFIEHYRQLIAGAHNAADLKVILGALPGAADPGALQLAVSMLDNPDVRPEAELAIRKIAAAIQAQHPAAAEEALKKLAALAPKGPAVSE